MFALGIPKRQYRRTTRVLGHELSEPIDYRTEKQDDGFYLFTFPGTDEDNFRKIVILLKNNGITTIGADNQLTEKNIMKLADLINLKEQNTTSGEFDVKLDEPNDFTDKVKIKYGYVTGPIDDVTISWGNESHKVDFEETDESDVVQKLENSEVIDYVAYSEDEKWRFMVNVNVDDQGNIFDVYWKTLDISDVSFRDSKLGGAMDDDDVERAFTVDAPDRSLQEQFQRLAGIKPLYEQGFDSRLSQAMGMSDDEFEDQVASRDIGDVSAGYKKASDLKDKLREEYRSMSDQDLDDFSVEMIKHFLDNMAAKDYAKRNLNTTTSRLDTL